MLVVGPTGAGKSVLLALIALQFRRYAGAQLYIFDKGWSARAAVLAMGGAHHSLGLAAEGSGELSFQPLRDIDAARSEEHTSELQSLMRTSYAVFFLKKKNNKTIT